VNWSLSITPSARSDCPVKCDGAPSGERGVKVLDQQQIPPNLFDLSNLPD
jgi:hypothetical protein